MPRLILCAACEKPLTGADNSLSMINVLHNVRIVTTPEPGDQDAGNPHWYVIAMWRRDEDEAGRFQQRITIADPTGKVRLQSLSEFEMPKAFHRNITRIQGFPSSPQGDYEVSIAITQMTSEEAKWVEAGSFPVRVEIHRPVLSPSTTAH